MSGIGIGISEIFQRASVGAPIPPVPPVGPLYDAYVYLHDLKGSGVDGGASVSGSWETRDITTEVEDTANICALAANQFTLQAGTYRILASAPNYQGGTHQIRLYNVTDGTLELLGASAWDGNITGAQTKSLLNGRFTIAGAKVFEVQHRVAASQAANGHGIGLDWGNNIYTIVELWRET